MMRKVLWNLMLIASFILMQSCSSDDGDVTSLKDTQKTSAATSAVSFDTDVETFDFSIDESSLAEQETVTASDEDYVENTTFTKTVNIVFEEDNVICTGDLDDQLTFTCSNGHAVITSSANDTVCYMVSGSTNNGSLTINSERKLQLRLEGVSITNPSGAAINIQGKKRVFVVLVDGTENTLVDGSGFSTPKACLFSKGQIIFSGRGRLKVYGNNKAGIRSSDYIVVRPGVNLSVETTQGNAIKGDDALRIYGGVINVKVSAAGSKGLSSDGSVLVSGGRTTAIVTGASVYDSETAEISGSACVKADSTFNMTGGMLYLKNTGKGGKGISVDQDAYFSGGSARIITTGSTYKYGSDDSKAKGIKADGNITVSGGTLKVRTTGGDGCEGVEAKNVFTITNGSIAALAYDDAINSGSHLYIKGGTMYAHSTGNDGLDANGNLYVQGGNTVAYGSRAPECGIDANEEQNFTCYFTGGNLFAIGGGNSTPSNSTSSQAYLSTSGSVSKGSVVAVFKDDALMASFSLPASYSGGSILFTVNGMSAGNEYAFSIDDASTTLTATQYGSSRMGGGGNPPGGGRR